MEESTIEDIVRKEFQSEIVDCEELSGDAKETYKVVLSNGQEFILHICRKTNLEDRFEVEDLTSQIVSENSDVPVPKVIASDLSKQDFSYMYFISEKIDGYNPLKRFKYMPIDEKKTILRQLGRYMGRFHRDITFDSFGQFNYSESDGLEIQEGSWPDVFMQIMEKQLSEVSHDAFDDLVPIIREILEDNLHLLEGNFQPVMVHQDYGPRNIMVDEGSISGIIDWERAISGHKEYDLFKAERRFIDDRFNSREVREELRPVLFEGYLEENALSSGWRERRKLYRYCYNIESIWTFHIWESTLDEEKKDQVIDFYRSYLQDGLGSSQDWFYANNESLDF